MSMIKCHMALLYLGKVSEISMIPILSQSLRHSHAKPYSCSMGPCKEHCPARDDTSRRHSTQAGCQHTACQPGSRKRSHKRFLQQLHPQSKCQKVELDPLYETIFFVSCCPLLSQARAARGGACRAGGAACGREPQQGWALEDINNRRSQPWGLKTQLL